MVNETMRIFFPLKIFSYPQYDCSEDEREDISPREAVVYEDQILAAIAKENRHFENDRGLAEYIQSQLGEVHEAFNKNHGIINVLTNLRIFCIVFDK